GSGLPDTRRRGRRSARGREGGRPRRPAPGDQRRRHRRGRRLRGLPGPFPARRPTAPRSAPAGLHRGGVGRLPVRGPDLPADRPGRGRLPVITPIVIDCDPGQDDAIAILLALASPEVDVRAITTVAGNQTLEKTTRNALKVLELAGRADIPVAAGAAGPLRRS